MALTAPLLPAAEVTGRVLNGTTGQPAADVQVNLIALRGQMVPVREGATDAQGRFRLIVAANPNERFLVQVPFRGVLYSQPAVFTGSETVTADITVYETGARPEDIRLDAHTIFLEPHRDHIRLNHFYAVSNLSRPPRTYAPDGGSFRFALPDTVGDLQVSAGRAGGMPLRQQPQETGEPGVLAIPYALKPEQTEIQVSYAIPLTGNTAELRLPLLHPTERRHLALPRAGLTLDAQGITEIEQDQVPQARVFALATPVPGEFAARLTIDPEALQAFSSAPVTPASPPAGAVAAPQGAVQIVPHPVARARWYIVGLALFVLALGLYYLYAYHPGPDTAHAGSTQPDTRAPHDNPPGA